MLKKTNKTIKEVANEDNSINDDEVDYSNSEGG
jgi:hypothetical protein